MELDADIGKVMAAIRAEAPNSIVIVTADNGAWQDAYPDAGTTPSAIACTRVQPHNVKLTDREAARGSGGASASARLRFQYFAGGHPSVSG